MHMPLLKGTEVLLTFIDGDPDRPIIQGAVPNSVHNSVVTNIDASGDGSEWRLKILDKLVAMMFAGEK